MTATLPPRRPPEDRRGSDRARAIGVTLLLHGALLLGLLNLRPGTASIPPERLNPPQAPLEVVTLAPPETQPETQNEAVTPPVVPRVAAPQVTPPPVQPPKVQPTPPRVPTPPKVATPKPTIPKPPIPKPVAPTAPPTPAQAGHPALGAAADRRAEAAHAQSGSHNAQTDADAADHASAAAFSQANPDASA